MTDDIFPKNTTLTGNQDSKTINFRNFRYDTNMEN